MREDHIARQDVSGVTCRWCDSKTGLMRLRNAAGVAWRHLAALLKLLAPCGPRAESASSAGFRLSFADGTLTGVKPRLVAKARSFSLFGSLEVRMRISRVVASLLLCVASAISMAEVQPVMKKGALLTKSGFSLYVFDNDVTASGSSVCNLPCSNVFPPLLAGPRDAAKGEFSFIARQDGTKQWAYKGRPLYRFYGDEKPGQQGGDGINRNLWHVARQ